MSFSEFPVGMPGFPDRVGDGSERPGIWTQTDALSLIDCSEAGN